MTDPRGELEEQRSERGVLPVVARPRAGLSVPILILGMLAAAILLFIVLDTRRRSLSAPSTLVRGIDAPSLPSAPLPLTVPLEPVPPLAEPAAPLVVPLPPRPTLPPPLQPPPTPAPRYATPLLSQPPPSMPTVPARLLSSGGPALAVDTSSPRAATDGTVSPPASGAFSGQSGAAAVGGTDRVHASIIADRSTTVPQGTLIPAVLETAFNSTRAGFARAIVARNVVGFDGTRVLIPRGSRLIGEYQSDTTPGQKRALILWTRLIRDDGASIAIGSPAADTVGRGGVRAQVDSHFLERFSGAILQSALNVGVNLASRAANGTVVLALPNAIQNGGGAPLVSQTNIPPTLKVRAGTSISVFVARDLDFTDVERAP